MYKSFRFWFVIFLAILHLSFFTDMREWWYARKSFRDKVKTVTAKFQKGIVLPMFAIDDDYPYLEAVDEIANTGARSISIFCTNYQEDIRANYIYLNQRAAEITRLSEIIDYAHKRGMSVFLFPTLHIQHLGYKEWRGVLKPADPEVWWDSYFRMIHYYLDVAREQNVEMFSIGSELCSMEDDYEHWSRIIRSCRKDYAGLLTYSANWDHYHNITFMKDLDYMGMNAYFGLTKTKEPKLEELLKAWEPAKKRIEEAYQEYETPMIFTEIGYPSVDGANKDPWNYFATTPLDLDEQTLCYQAFVQTWDPPPSYLHGVYIYNWWGPGGPEDRDYTPRGKPAEQILRRWYLSLK